MWNGKFIFCERKSTQNLFRYLQILFFSSTFGNSWRLQCLLTFLSHLPRIIKQFWWDGAVTLYLTSCKNFEGPKKLWASCYLNVGWNNKCVKLWKEWKLHTWFFFCPFFVAIQNLHTSACNLHTKATFSVNITFRQPNFVNMHGKPMCMFGNLVFNISIHVKNFIYISNVTL